MKSLRQRLAQFDRGTASTTPSSRRRSPDGDPLARLLAQGGHWVGASPTGHLRFESTQNAHPGAPFDCIAPEAFDLLGCARPRGEHWVVLDTETTGLESGTGTLVFMIGLLHWTSGGMRRVQLLMPEPAAEASMLTAFLEEIDGADLLISYNGRSFDAPRLRNRLLLQRFDASTLDRPHLDLVYPARRIVRPWIGGVRQLDLERALLGLERENDLPGAFAPEVYRSLLADRLDTGLAEVLLHNARDVDHLIPIAIWMASCVGETPPGVLPAASRLAIARLHEERGSPATALQQLRALVDDGQDRVEARRALALTLRRRGEFEESCRLWREVIDQCPMDIEAHVEAAKLCEHRLGDLEAAREIVSTALRAWQDRRILDHGARGDSSALMHRLQRIRRRIARRNDNARPG